MTERKIKGFFMPLLCVVFLVIMQVNGFASDECTIELSDSTVQTRTFTLAPGGGYLSYTYIYTNMDAIFALSVNGNPPPSIEISAAGTSSSGSFDTNKQAHVLANTTMKPNGYTPPAWATHTIYIIHSGGSGITSDETWDLNVHIDACYPATLQMKIVSSNNSNLEMVGASDFTDCPSNQPPTATITFPTGPQTIFEGEQISFVGEATDEDPSSLTILWTFGAGADPLTSNVSNPTVTFNNQGTYDVEFKVTDSDNNEATDNVLITVNVNNPPMICPIPTPLTATAGTPLSFIVVSHDDNNAPASLDYSIPTVPTGQITFVDVVPGEPGTKNFTFNPDPDDIGETFTVTFTATDDTSLQATLPVVINVENATPTIAINPPLILTATVGTPLSFTLVSSDDNPQPARLGYDITSSSSPSNIPAAGSIDFPSGTGVFTYTPPLSDAGGSFTMTFTAEDSIDQNLQAALDVIIEVEQVNNPPVIDPISSPKTANVGQPLTFDVVATDTDGTTPELSYSISPQPTNYPNQPQFDDPDDDGIWTFTFTPVGAEQGQTFMVRFVAEDSEDRNLQDTQCVAINVVPHIEISPPSLYFTVPVGDTSGTGVVTIRNLGDRNVELHIIPPVFYPYNRGKFDVTFENSSGNYDFDNPVYTYLLPGIPGDSEVTLGVRYTALRECDTDKTLMIRCGSLGYDVSLHGKGRYASSNVSFGISYGNINFESFQTIPFERRNYFRSVVDYMFSCRWRLELFLNVNSSDFNSYGLNIGYMLPIKSSRFKPYLTLGVGLMNFNKAPEGTEYKDKERALTVNFGAGFRLYPFSKRRLGFFVELKDLVLFNAYDTGVTHNLQYNGGIIINIGKTK